MFKTREAPAPEQLSEPPIDIPVEQPACPARGGEGSGSSASTSTAARAAAPPRGAAIPS